MRKHKILIRQGRYLKTLDVELMIYKSWFIFGWWKRLMVRTGSQDDVSHYVHAWATEYALDVSVDVEDLT